jgi:hypothetical protein
MPFKIRERRQIRSTHCLWPLVSGNLGIMSPVKKKPVRLPPAGFDFVGLTGFEPATT